MASYQLLWQLARQVSVSAQANTVGQKKFSGEVEKEGSRRAAIFEA